MLQKNSPSPEYRQLKDILAAKIKSKELSCGMKLPSESRLCHDYGTSRITVRRALGILATEGLVFTVNGKGTFVRETALDVDFGEILSFSALAAKSGSTVSTTVIEQRIITGDAVLAAKLSIPPDWKIIALTRLRYRNGAPVIIEYRYLPEKLFPGFVEENLGAQSLTELLQTRYRIKISRRSWLIAPVQFAAREAALLEVKKGAAGLEFNETFHYDGNRILKWEKSFYKKSVHLEMNY